MPEHQLLTFRRLFPSITPGGLYIIEGTETSYWKEGARLEGAVRGRGRGRVRVRVRVRIRVRVRVRIRVRVRVGVRVKGPAASTTARGGPVFNVAAVRA